MKQPKNTIAYLAMFCLCLVLGQDAFAQGYDNPLSMQGLNRTTTPSVSSRAAGGTMLGIKNDASLMFSNPAMLGSLQGLQLSLGGLQQSTYSKQDQRYGGIQSHSAFSPLVEGTTGLLSNPDTTKFYGTTQVRVIDQSDSVQRPFDNLGPNWNRSKSNSAPVQAFLAAPFSLKDVRVVLGVGFVEYANLNWYYQNNNCFSPSVLSVLNGTIATSGLNANPYLTQWYQYYQQRDGSIKGYGAALSVALSDQFSLGASGLILEGSTDDSEVRVGRGRMLFFTSSLRLDKQGMLSYAKTGTSDYSGKEFTLGGTYTGQSFTAGFSVKPPTVITRKFSSSSSLDSVTTVSKLSSRVDSLHFRSTTSSSGEDKINLPLRASLGVSIAVRPDFTIGIEYEIRPYSSATYTDAGGQEINPWLSASLWHAGAQYRANSWLIVRGGVSENAEVFQPLSKAIRGEPIKYPVYSLGGEMNIASLRVNVTYEYSDMKFIDTWSNAVSINREIRNNLIASLSYQIPW
ncbi:MAG: hypothetical protein V1799_11330 [bacterium]